jgi:phosphate transport system substrate-binding protein
VVRRADGSGTSFNFTNYLSKVNAEWKTKVGEGTAVKWPTGFGGKGNEGVAAYVKQIAGGIGYVEMSYALQNKMTYARMKNAAGNFVMPNDESFQAAAASADWKNAKDFYLVMTNAPGEQAWPITATNFILMYKQPKNAEGAKNAKDFFEWAYTNGDEAAAKLDYVPLPDALVKQIEAYWSQNLKY